MSKSGAKDRILLRVGEPGLLAPGQLPLPDDDDDAVAHRSPKKLKGPPMPVDLETLRGLLAEQVAVIQEAHREALSQAVDGLRADLDGHKRELRREIKAAEESVQQRVDATDVKLESLVARVVQLEQRGGADHSGAPPAPERHRCTLVYGGWQRESARKDILAELGKALTALDLDPLTDTAPFTTGQRRSMALQAFKIRPGETEVGMRGRMSAIVAALSTSTILLSGERKLWSAFSKPKEVRLNGDHAAWVRRTIRGLSEAEESRLETEYNTGCCWFHDLKISSAVESRGDKSTEELVVNEDRPGKPWIDAAKIAELLKMPVARVVKAINDSKR